MIVYDEAEDKTSAYKHCMRECTRECKESRYCRDEYKDGETLCRNGMEDDKLHWPGFEMNGKYIKACREIIAPKVTPPEPKHVFDSYELLRLFESK